MTLIVAYVSQAGAVMAADSHVTEEDSTAGPPVDKIWTSGGLLFGYSGDLTLRDVIRDAITAALERTPLPAPAECEMVVSQLKTVVRPVLESAYRDFVGGPLDNPVEKLGGSLLVVGRDTERYWLLEISSNCWPTNYTEEGFHTIGSATIATHIGRRLLGHYAVPGYETRHLCLLAFRVLESCIAVLGSAYSIGGEVQLWQSTDGGFEAVTGEALSSVREGLEQWKRVEQESLLAVFATAQSVAEELIEGLPEALSPEKN